MCGRGSGRIEKKDEDARFERSEVDARATELPGAMPGPGQCPLTNTKTIA
jgi:hypothetical protein